MNNLLKVEFNDYDLTKHLTITSLRRNISSGNSTRYKSKNGKKGVDFVGTNSSVTSITMDFMIDQDVSNNMRSIANIINVFEPKKMIISDEPNLFYYAYPIGDITNSEIKYKSFGTITWEIPDGVAHSVHEYTFVNGSEEQPTNLITVDNPGTEQMDLSLTAEFKSDNGFLGIENEIGDSRALFGQMNEVDGFSYEASDQLFNDHLYIDQGWTLNNGILPPVAPNMRQQGSVTYHQESLGEGFVRAIHYGEPGPTWSGPSLTKTVPADVNGEYALNWVSTFRSDFNTDGGGSSKDKASQVGHQSVTYIDQNDQVIVSVVIEDNNPSAEKSDFAIYVKDRRVYDSRNTSSYYNTARPGSGNHIRVEKMGGRVTVELAGIGFKQSFPYPDRVSELRKVTFYAARFKDRRPMHNNLIRALNVIKHHVEKWEDIPNKFKDGDTLEYGKEGRNVYCLVNDMNELRMRDVGSTLLTAPPGTSRFYLMYSDFSETPRVRLKGRAKYT